ncbi:hypothetical protein Tco_1458322 [Tanacetum coccineum]
MKPHIRKLRCGSLVMVDYGAKPQTLLMLILWMMINWCGVPAAFWIGSGIGAIAYRRFIFIPNCDDDQFLFSTRGLPSPVSWLGSHTKRVIAAMSASSSNQVGFWRDVTGIAVRGTRVAAAISDIQHPKPRPKTANTSTFTASDILYVEVSPNMPTSSSHSPCTPSFGLPIQVKEVMLLKINRSFPLGMLR